MAREFAQPNGERLTFLKTATETNGDLLEMEAIYNPNSPQPPLHYHPYQEEQFRVLSGTFRTKPPATRDGKNMSEQSLKLNRGISWNRHARIAWALVGLYATLATAGLILLFRPGMPQSPFYSGWHAVLQSVGLLVMAVMGALIVSRHPGHPNGWLFAAVSLLLGVGLFAFGYAAYGLVANPGSLPGALEMAAIADNVAFMAPFSLIVWIG